MRKSQAWLIVALIGMIVGGWSTQNAARADDSGPIIVIVNVNNSVQTLSMAELRKIFLSERTRWDTGKPVAPVMVVAGNPVRTAFLKIVYGMRDTDFRKYFLHASFTGKDVTPPTEVSASNQVKVMVAGSPSAIGFIRALDFHGDGSDGGIKAVKIDSLPASDPAYKLRM
jgi:ABC-type phosphate transport system substrate-binding protein